MAVQVRLPKGKNIFFSTKLCKYNHLEGRYASNGTCVGCTKENNRRRVEALCRTRATKETQTALAEPYIQPISNHTVWNRYPARTPESTRAYISYIPKSTLAPIHQ